MKKSHILILLLGALFFVPWLGEILFNTKGEPREAIVAVSMLDSGNWILPVSHGVDIPYKPPMLAWLIAMFSFLFNGGVVNEFTSRLPSAVAAIALLMAGWHWVAPRVGRTRAWLMLIITATSFEFFRAASACRVDMVLTACMVGAVYAIYNIKSRRINILWAILLLSGATLTKGPVGSLLPCLAMGIYFLLRGDNFWRTLGLLTGICVASFVLPALWYYAAWTQGGDEFMRLAMEENIGRLTGTMSYDSHVNPWYYNIVTVVSGMLPWTVIVLMGLCYKRIRRSMASLKLDRNQPLMAWTVALTVFVFYCIPESKRSVYLLPCYPFMAYGAAWIVDSIKNTRVAIVWARVLAVLAVVAPLTLLCAQFVPSLSGTRLQMMPWWRWPLALVPVAAGLWWLVTRKSHANAAAGMCLATFTMLFAYNAAFAPMVLNPKSDVAAAEKIVAHVGDDSSQKIYAIVEGDSLLRYYTINFYLKDRLLRAADENGVPSGCYFVAPWASDNAVVVDTLTERSCDTRQPAILLKKR